ncbi:hypothetical protein [Algoriphagus taiwanensis]|uniref:Uncharacterized protein n=1 Tax=Algoriphagus taiwanensis TaxID=1445656 RepID=A0ABQ6Q6E6_9BACT|nr:hypothetical protein Ataiwa_40150 [Algoriphagus taiwanensis]
MNQKDTSFGLLIGETTAGLVQQGIAKSGAERLRLDICARFNIRSSIELLY